MDKETIKLIKSIQQLETDLSDYRDCIKDNPELSKLHFAISDYLTISNNRE